MLYMSTTFSHAMPGSCGKTAFRWTRFYVNRAHTAVLIQVIGLIPS